MAKPQTGVHSGMVRTVLGPIPVEAMGVTLMHEHILLDTSSWWKRPCCASDIGFAERPLDISMIGDLRMNPFLNRDNCGLARREGRDRGTRAISSNTAAGRSSIRRTSASAATRPRCSASAGARASISSWARDFILRPRIRLPQGYVRGGDRRGHRKRLRRLGGRAGSLRWDHRRDRREQGLHAGRGESAARRARARQR